ncbi:MAG: carbon-nitrogen hydrolase family protein [Candidatus Tectomicrobia bacterium]|nr:carbon-nitrogen hydrolase family protein [Candidatus Tectomicrobia bacterium]
MALVRVAAVQPLTRTRDREPENLAAALDDIRRAAQGGARFVCFPEGYPGPYSGPMDFDPTGDLASAAKAHGVYIIAGRLEEAGPEAFYNVLDLYGPSGERVYRYRRCQSAGDGVDVPLFGRRVREGDELKVLETPFGNVGLLVCSEVFSPELSRVLALGGADILFYPAGGVFYELSESWRVLVRARAIENYVYTVMCQNLFGMESGITAIAGPEGLLAERDTPGLVFADLDIDRLKYLRETREELVHPKPYRTIPGLMDAWRKPGLYRRIVEPQAPSGQTPGVSGRPRRPS